MKCTNEIINMVDNPATTKITISSILILFSFYLPFTSFE